MSRPVPKGILTVLTQENWRHFNAEEAQKAQEIVALMTRAQDEEQPLVWKLTAEGKLNPQDAATLANLRESFEDGNKGLAILVMMATARRQLPKQN